MKSVTAFAVLLVILSAPAWAGWDEGAMAYDRGDYATALRELTPLAEQGHPGAQLALGLMYDNGWGVPEERSEAARWFRAAALQGDAMAQAHLARLYFEGLGVGQDYTEAYAWISTAAVQGYVGAEEKRQALLAKMTPSDVERAEALARGYQKKYVSQ